MGYLFVIRSLPRLSLSLSGSVIVDPHTFVKVFFFTKGDVQDVIPSNPTAVRPCSLALAALPVTQVSVERLFSAMRLLLSDLAVPVQAGRRRCDVPASHEHDLNK